MTSIRRSSWQAASRLRSRTRTLRHSVRQWPQHAPASLQTEPPHGRTPDLGHAAMWSPKGSWALRHRHGEAVKGSGKRSLRNKKTRKRGDARVVSGDVGQVFFFLTHQVFGGHFSIPPCRSCEVRVLHIILRPVLCWTDTVSAPPARTCSRLTAWKCKIRMWARMMSCHHSNFMS